MAAEVRAFAPGRVNLIGEHTDYNDGLALPFATTEGVTVRAEPSGPAGEGARIHALAADLGEEDEFPLGEIEPAEGWRAFVRGTVAELDRAGFRVLPARLEIGGDLPLGGGLSSSAALEVALCVALIEIGARDRTGERPPIDRLAVARLCSRVENDWVGAKTGLLDQLASLYGEPDSALCIDFRSLDISPVRFELGDWKLVLVDSGERHAHASSGYNDRRRECASACELLGVRSLRDADADSAERLPAPLDRRVRHVIGENKRVGEAVAALRDGDLGALGALLNASHRSLREGYQVSTPAVEATVERLLRSGAAGARLMGGGFGGSVLGLFAPGAVAPADALEVRPGPGAHLVGPS